MSKHSFTPGLNSWLNRILLVASAQTGHRFLLLGWSLYQEVPVSHEILTKISVPGMNTRNLRGLRLWKKVSIWKSRNSPISAVMTGFPSGRLGNRLLELAIAHRVSTLMSIPRTILLERHDYWGDGFPMFGQIDLYSRKSETRYAAMNRRAGEAGSCVLQVDFLNSFPDLLSDPYQLEDSFSYLREHRLLSGASARSTVETVLHFRGTDRLNTLNSPQYRPPPLSYYVYCCLREKAEKVCLVSDDVGSDAFRALCTLLTNAGISVQQTDASLENDLHALLSARVLVLGGSSLSDVCAGLAPSLERAYFFKKSLWTRRDVELHEVFDIDDSYDNALDKIADDIEPRMKKLIRSYPLTGLRSRTIRGDLS